MTETVMKNMEVGRRLCGTLKIPKGRSACLHETKMNVWSPLSTNILELVFPGDYPRIRLIHLTPIDFNLFELEMCWRFSNDSHRLKLSL